MFTNDISFQEENNLSAPSYAKRIQDAVLQSLLESSVLFSSAIAIHFFLPAAHPFYAHPLTIASFVGLANFFLRLPFASYENESYIASPFRYIRSVLFVNYDAFYRAPLFHEAAHALTALYFYPHSHPHIHLEPPIGGITKYFSDESAVHRLSISTKNGLISAAGPCMDLLWCYGALFCADVLKDKKPGISLHLLMSAWFIMVGNIVYAFSALAQYERESNDYYSIQKNLGIHPGIIAVCLTVQLILSVSRQLKNLAPPPADTASQLGTNRFSLFYDEPPKADIINPQAKIEAII